MQYSNKYLAFMGMWPKKIPHWEHWSCPDAETYLTGIDYYEHPKLCRERMRELYPQLELPVPQTDDPKPRPTLSQDGQSKRVLEKGAHVVRWGDGESSDWNFGRDFKTTEDVFSFSPLSDDPEITKWLDEDKAVEILRKDLAPDCGDKPPEGQAVLAGFYNTMFMWPLLTFGWRLFLECCLDRRFERIMDEFAEINRHVFRAFSRLPINFMVCHDDIANNRGPICSPTWMRKYVFPRYEEYWATLKNAGIEVLFMSDGNMTEYADDVIARGARGIISEPSTDYKKIAREHNGKNLFLAGEGDSRILMRNNPDEIRAMVEGMVETSKMTGGYVMCVGNHIPWNVPPEGIKRYLDCSVEWAHR